MPDSAKGILIILVSGGLGLGVAALINLALGGPVELPVAMAIGLGFGLLYGIEAGLLLAYDMASWRGWVQLLVDFTWSLPNTLFGFVFGNIIYIFVGNPNRQLSRDKGWIAFKPRSVHGTFGHSVLQTLGTVNLGGDGQHELMHLLQARIFGPLYLVIFAANYVINFLIQVIWSGTIGLLLWGLKIRQTPYFRPPSTSAVSGFFGWIYYATIFELWAYASGNP